MTTLGSLDTRGVFGRLEWTAPDALLALIGQYRSDPRPGKLDLGVGVYRDEGGATPIMAAVKEAERMLVDGQRTKSYLAPEGDARFVELLAEIVFGQGHPHDACLTGVQTPGGTGALRMAAELVARANPSATVWIGDPSWPNHAPIFQSAGLETRAHAFFDRATQSVRFDALMDELEATRPGDVLLLHGCCHNPTGAKFEPGQWNAIAALAVRRGLLPIIDLAYQGLGDGLDEDAASTRLFVEQLQEVLVAYSCDKNFGLYRERTGVLWAKADNADWAAKVRSNMLSLARANWSMPPDHGAAIVRLILDHDELRADWQEELGLMRKRILSLRHALSQRHSSLAPLSSQSGMFALLPIDREAVAYLREAHGIYMTADARINIAGLSTERIDDFVIALEQFL